MKGMFANSIFKELKGDISKWDVSKVTDMSSMFEFSNFNGDISAWDVSKVTDMKFIFKY
jgi:surface protein